MQNIIKTENLKKSFFVKIGKIEVLKGINLEIKKGDFGIIFGPSGCGKSTLLHTLIGLEKPTEGKVYFEEKDLYALNEDERADLREKKIGMLYQQPTWITSLRVLENVALPLILQGYSFEKASPLALSALAQMGMEKWKDFFPQELSSGQQQRIGLARAIVSNPDFLIADEPTGNLDEKSGERLLEFLKWQNQVFGRTILMVTHDLRYLSYGNVFYQMLDGKIIKVYREKDKEELLLHIKKEILKPLEKVKEKMSL